MVRREKEQATANLYLVVEDVSVLVNMYIGYASVRVYLYDATDKDPTNLRVDNHTDNIEIITGCS